MTASESDDLRHGARLDVSDRAWRDSAEKPYDTPLSYGGWLQCQMLGARIANELRFLDATRKVEGGSVPKRRKIVIHSSPYLRCVQTSIAISARLQDLDSQSSRPNQFHTNIKEEDHEEAEAESGTDKTILRLDSFLEEWRSASYFENTVPPASSSELLEAAKEALKKPAEDIRGADISVTPPIQELASIDWVEKKHEANALSIPEKAGLRQQMSKRARHLSDVHSNGRPARSRSSTVGYSPPIPTYALAPVDPIPVGFTAHARDACLDIDFEWDSLKDWGDGGVWDEEWGLMHRRVGNGLKKMIAHYSEIEDEEIVLILVTHQACCNALIRNMTGAPALHDIGTSSLTMAVRRDDPLTARPKSPTSRRGSVDMGLPREFEMKIVASTEHLRGGSNPLGLNSPRLGQSPALASRRIVGADSPEGFSLGDPWRPQAMARSFSHRSSEADREPPVPEGLWRAGTPRKASAENAVEVEAPTQLWTTADESRSLPVRSAPQRMWTAEPSIRRERSPGKRSWTAIDRSP